MSERATRTNWHGPSPATSPTVVDAKAGNKPKNPH